MVLVKAAALELVSRNTMKYVLADCRPCTATLESARPEMAKAPFPVTAFEARSVSPACQTPSVFKSR